MRWKGQELKTYGDYTDALGALTTEEDATEFVRLAREEGPTNADANLGYLTGYFSREKGERIRRLIKIPHPVFGMEITMTDEEIMQHGYERGKAASKARN